MTRRYNQSIIKFPSISKYIFCVGFVATYIYITNSLFKYLVLLYFKH